MAEHIPLYTEVDKGSLAPLELQPYKPTFWESVKTGFEEGLSYNPTVNLANQYKIRDADSWLDATDGYESDTDFANNAEQIYANYRKAPERYASIEKQTEKIKAARLTGQIQPNEYYTEEALDIIIDGAHERNFREFTQREAPGWHMAGYLPGAFAAGALDPINIASVFIPVTSVENMAAVAASRTGAALTRAQYNMVRARAGAISGFTGAAAVEPIIASGMQDIQNPDYGMVASAMNLAFGSILGAAVTPLAGSVGDFIRARRHAPQPWEYLPSSIESESLMQANATRIERERMAANPELDRALVAEEARADAMIYDQTLRRLGYEQNASIAEMYNRHGLVIRNGEAFNIEVDAAARRLGEIEARLDEMVQNRSPFGFRDTYREQALQMQLATARQQYTNALQASEANLAGLTRVTEITPENIGQSADNAYSRLTDSKPATIDTINSRTDIWQQIDRKFRTDRQTINQHSGNVVHITEDDALGIVVNTSDERKLYALANIENIMRNAIHAGRYTGKNQHLYLARVNIDGQEYHAGLSFIARDGRQHLQNIEMTPARAGAQQGEPSPVSRMLQKMLQDESNVPGSQAAASPAASAPGRERLLVTRNAAGELQGTTRFNENNRAILQVYKANDQTTVRRGIAHISRQLFADYTSSAKADSRLAQSYRELENHYGIVDGVWTAAQEQQFADDFIRYTLDGKQALAKLMPAFEGIRQRMFDAYADADAARVAISDQTRDFFDAALATPIHKGFTEYQKAVSEIMTRNYAEELASEQAAIMQTRRGMVTDSRKPTAVETIDTEGATGSILPDFDAVNIPDTDPRMLTMAEQRHAYAKIDTDFEYNTSQAPSEIVDALRINRDLEISAIDDQLKNIQRDREFMGEYIACMYQAGPQAYAG